MQILYGHEQKKLWKWLIQKSLKVKFHKIVFMRKFKE